MQFCGFRQWTKQVQQLWEIFNTAVFSNWQDCTLDAIAWGSTYIMTETMTGCTPPCCRILWLLIYISHNKPITEDRRITKHFAFNALSMLSDHHVECIEPTLWLCFLMRISGRSGVDGCKQKKKKEAFFDVVVKWEWKKPSTNNDSIKNMEKLRLI